MRICWRGCLEVRLGETWLGYLALALDLLEPRFWKASAYDDGEGIAVITFASPQPPVTRSGHESHYLRRKNLESAIVT